MARILLAATLALGACSSDDEVTADTFPIAIDLTGGPVIAQISEAGGEPQVAVIDALRR